MNQGQLSIALKANTHRCAGGRQSISILFPEVVDRHAIRCITDSAPDSATARFARGSQSYPSPAAEADADGSTTVYFGPTQPANVERGNWIQTVPGKGWFTLLRLYSPLESFFTKEWRLSEVELVQ